LLGNYGLIIAVLAVYALWVFFVGLLAVSHRSLISPRFTFYVATVRALSLKIRLTNPLLLISLGFLIGGFAAINKWGT
jgi:hypothetical protein